MFFFKYIAGLTESHIDSEMKTLVQDQTTQFLTYMDQRDTGHYIRWDWVNELAVRLIRESQHNVTYITANNNQLRDDAQCIIVIFGIVIGVLILYLTFRGADLQLKFIFMENLIIFAFVGMIEVYFFVNIASKYIPVLPDDAIKAVFSRIKTDLAQ